MWIAVGGTPASVVRAGRHGLPLYLAILGQPERFAPLADLYRHSGAAAGHLPETLRVGVTSHFHVGATSRAARNTFYPYYSRYIGDNMPAARCWRQRCLHTDRQRLMTIGRQCSMRTPPAMRTTRREVWTSRPRCARSRGDVERVGVS